MKRRLNLTLSFLFACFLGGCGKEAASVGIIGGADGPNAVFVSTTINWQAVAVLTVVIFLSILAAVIMRRRKK